MINEYFNDQFYFPSNYNIDIDWSHDHFNDIDFSPEKISRILPKINYSNKAYAKTLAVPFSIIFKLSYNNGTLPREWNLANVVPVHKKGAKDDVQNYMQISLTCLIMKVFCNFETYLIINNHTSMPFCKQKFNVAGTALFSL